MLFQLSKGELELDAAGWSENLGPGSGINAQNNTPPKAAMAASVKNAA